MRLQTSCESIDRAVLAAQRARIVGSPAITARSICSRALGIRGASSSGSLDVQLPIRLRVSRISGLGSEIMTALGLTSANADEVHCMADDVHDRVHEVERH